MVSGFDLYHNYYQLYLLSILKYNIFTGECCMPGYEEERSRLRHYLGIEWIPKGLGKMDG